MFNQLPFPDFKSITETRLQAVQLGLESREEKSLARILTESNMFGSTMHDQNKVIDEANQISDYHEALQHLHKNFVIPDYATDEDKLANSLIHDILKKGVPKGNDVAIIAEHMCRLVHTHTAKKYDKFIKNRCTRNTLYAPTLDKAIMTPDEINSIPRHMHHAGLRVFVNNNSVLHAEHHPIHGLEFVNHPHVHRLNMISESMSAGERVHVNEEHLKETTNPDIHQEFRNYTEESAPINRYLALTAKGTSFDDDDEVVGKSVRSIKKNIEGLDDTFADGYHNIHYGKPLQLYTGVYQENNIKNLPKDSRGNYIFYNPSFTSTSLDLHTADGFAKSKKDTEISRGTREIISLRVPEWHPHAQYVGHVSHHASEREVLLHRGTKFRVHPDPIYVSLSQRPQSTRIWQGVIVPHDTQEHEPFLLKNDSNKIIHMMTNDMHPDVLHEIATTHSNPSVRGAAIYHRNFPIDKLSRDMMIGSLQEVSGYVNRKHLPDSHVIGIINHASPNVQRLLAGRKDLSEEHRTKLMDNGFHSVNARLAQRSDLSNAHINKLYNEGNPQVLTGLATNPNLHPGMATELLKHSNQSVRVAAAMNPVIPRDTLLKVLKVSQSSPGYAVSTAIHANPSFWRFEK